jgi:hypothetical protein
MNSTLKLELPELADLPDVGAMLAVCEQAILLQSNFVNAAGTIAECPPADSCIIREG